MKNVQVIDGAENCTYPIYAMEDEEFLLIFPEPGQDIEFIEDVMERLSKEQVSFAFKSIWNRELNKRTVTGIHGTLFYELYHKKKYYPTKRDSEMTNGNGIPHRR